MPPTLSTAAALTEGEFDTLRAVVTGAVDRLNDRQILDLADDLHDVLRARRRLRGQVHGRIHDRLCGRVADLRI